MLAGTAPLPAHSQAISGEVFLARELATPPRLQGPDIRYRPQAVASERLQVMLSFVVDTAGVPEPGSVRVTTTPDSAYAKAARLTILRRRYRPGAFRGIKVRVLIEDRLTFKPEATPCDSVVEVDNESLCAASSSHGH